MIQVKSPSNPHEAGAMEQKEGSREEISAAVIFGCFNISGSQRFFSGTIHDCVEEGLRIESDAGFRKGTILLIRMINCPVRRFTSKVGESLRTVMLAEVKWRQILQHELGTRYIMGVRCL
jgi:hypothetical protein